MKITRFSFLHPHPLPLLSAHPYGCISALEIREENFIKVIDKYTWHEYNKAMPIKLGRHTEVSYEQRGNFAGKQKRKSKQRYL